MTRPVLTQEQEAPPANSSKPSAPASNNSSGTRPRNSPPAGTPPSAPTSSPCATCSSRPGPNCWRPPCAKKNGYNGASVNCQGCAQAAPFHSHRPKTFVSLFGPVALHRAYYRCGRCGRGRFPFDERACLSGRGLTLAAEEVVSLTGLLTDSFAEAAEKILPRLTGLHFGESGVERTTEDVGGVLGDWLDQGGALGDKTCWAWRRDANGRRVAYVSLDATGVPQQGPGGAAAEGRMPFVAMIYNPPANEPGAAAAPAAAGRSARDKAESRMQARYLAGLYTLPLLGLLLRKQTLQVGMGEAELWVGLSDAGNGLEDFMPRTSTGPTW